MRSYTMGDKSNIEWCDATWQVVSGCSAVSEGCRNCYSARLAAGRLRHHPRTAGLTRISWADGRPVWTGEVRIHEDQLDVPMRWRRPRRIFVADRGDLFNNFVPSSFIKKVFDRMRQSPQHTFLVLTKRAYRLPSELMALGFGPLPNVWVGVSVEDQGTADERIPALQSARAAVRWVSYEPAIGPVEWPHKWLGADVPNRLDWVVMGGESGWRTRRMDPAWAYATRDACRRFGPAFFMKQMSGGAAIPDDLMIRQWPAGRDGSVPQP